MPKLIDRLPFRRKAAASPLAEQAQALVRKAPDAVEASLQALGRSPSMAQVAPALLLATGAGVAFYWWTQWARGSAESEAAAKDKTKA